MHAQVVTFGLKDITEEQLHGALEADAQVFANMPGLVSKTWLRDSETNTYGGLYLWADQETYARYINGEVFASIKGNPHLENVESRDFDVFDDLTSITTPQLRVDA